MSGESGPPTVEGAPLGERPPEDEVTLTVAQARIAAKLFGVRTEVAVGRYRLLELVGRGGMGVVWGAWDPELERKVAIKLVDPLRSAARDRLVGEARALAKLSHPNVVPIYDVGAVDDRVYLVMEWVAGDNLRVHLRGRHSVRAIVDVYTQAARGLAAVHAAGFVHRDFKPENAMVGRDGRVRVLDFGLARADVRDAAGAGRDGEIAGTPRYMAPEQAAGAAPTPAVDQYALCVALREALVARDGDVPDGPAAASGPAGAEVPRWLGKLIARGTARRPEDRFASMEDLIRALGRDPARRLGRGLVVAGVLAAAVAGLVLGDRRTDAGEPCAGIAAMPPALSAATRARIGEQLERLGGFAAAELPALRRVLDEHERGLGTASLTACLAHARRELTPGMYERQRTCLARARASLVTTAELLTAATPDSFPGARVAASALVESALRASVDPSLVPPPTPAAEAGVRAAETALERARVLVTAERADAITAAAAARAVAEATGYAPVIGRALLIEGRARMVLGDGRAPAALERAMRTAIAARDDVTAVEAFARLAFVVASRDGRAVDGATVIEPLAARLGPEGTFARLLLLNNLAVVRLATGELAAARALLERAIRDWRPGRGEADYELASIPQNLALVAERPADSLGLLARARAEVARTLGTDHPKAIELQVVEVVFVGDLARARALQDDACARLARLFPHLREERAGCEYEAGWLADEAGDERGAAARFAAAVFDPAVDPVRLQVATRLAARPSGAAAARSLEHTAAEAATAGSPWLLAAAADAYVAAARSWERAGSREAARRCWAGALPLLEAIDRPASARRLARVRAQLARTMAAGAPARAGLARAAITWYRSVGGYRAAIAELAALVGDPR